MLTELGRLIPGIENPGRGGFAIGDFDGDGRDDIVVPGASGTAHFQVFGKGVDGIVSKQAVFLPDERLLRAMTVLIAGAPHLVTVSTDGMVRRFAGWPLAQAHSFDLGDGGFSAAAVGDIDNNGAMDLVVARSWGDFSGVHAYALATGALRWSIAALYPDDLMIAQLDGDPALEIVLAHTPGLVIDGATQATDWSYPDGFGEMLAGGRFQAGGGAQFVVGRDWEMLMTFQSSPWSPMWQVKYGDDISRVAAADLDGDGFDDILEGDGQWGTINVIDEQTHAVRLSIEHTGWGTSALAAWDAEGDGHPGIAFSPGEAYWPDGSDFTLASPVNGATRWRIPTGGLGPYHALAVGLVGGGTRMVYPVGLSFWGGWVEVDALSGQALWHSPSPDEEGGPFHRIVPVDAVYSPGGANGSLVLAGLAWSAVDSRLLSLDAQTHAIRWILDGTMLPAMERDVVAIAAVDLGGPPQIAACLNDTTSSRILLVDAESGAPGWLSISMSTADGECGVMAGRFSDSGNPLIVAVIDDSLRAYDAVTHTLAWFLQVPADGASLLEQGASGREFVVFEGTQLRFFDAATRTQLRAFDLGLPVAAVHQVRGDIRGLLVAAGGHLLVVDGISGVIRHATDYLGNNLGKGNRIATVDLGDGYQRVGIGSDEAVVRFRSYMGDGVFADGFEAVDD